MKGGNATRVSKKNLKKFCRRYPGRRFCLRRLSARRLFGSLAAASAPRLAIEQLQRLGPGDGLSQRIAYTYEVAHKDRGDIFDKVLYALLVGFRFEVAGRRAFLDWLLGKVGFRTGDTGVLS